MSTRRNEYLDHDDSEQSDDDAGYDSEAAELSKGTRTATSIGRQVKRRKLSHSEGEDDDDQDVEHDTDEEELHQAANKFSDGNDSDVLSEKPAQSPTGPADATEPTVKVAPTLSYSKVPKDKTKKPGVVYLSSLPPYLKPSALRNLLTQRGFTPITRLFLTPASKAKSTSKKNSRQLYTEGWIEFASKKMARRCAESLNAQIIGGKKGGFYYDDLWNMKYLKGMGWSELMAGIREERREEEGRQDEERRTIARETKRFVEGVEEGKRIEGIKRKRSEKVTKTNGSKEVDAGDDVKRTWRQFEVKGKGKGRGGQQKQETIGEDVREVLSKIF